MFPIHGAKTALSAIGSAMAQCALCRFSTKHRAQQMSAAKKKQAARYPGSTGKLAEVGIMSCIMNPWSSPLHKY
jgi:hypothetical protein